MSLILPKQDNRIGISLMCEGGELLTHSSLITAIEIERDSPFWHIHFGSTSDHGFDDRGVVILEESLLREMFNALAARLKENEK